MSDDLTAEVTTESATRAALLAPAALVLRRHDFRTRPVASSGSQPMLLAEDPLFLIGIVEFVGASDLPSVEAGASTQLADYVADAGAKQWDTYLVLLSAAAGTERGWSEDVTDILYNTRYLRRMVRWGVVPTESSLSSALRPFLSLPLPSTPGPIDPIQRLVNELPSHGVDTEKTATALAQWRASGDGDGDDV